MKNKMEETNMKGLIFSEDNGQYRFLPGRITYENDTITKVETLEESALTQEEKETYILPGLVDIHLHGCMGVDFSDCVKITAPAILDTICAYETANGITSICPATMTCAQDRLLEILQQTKEFVNHTAAQNIQDTPNTQNTQNKEIPQNAAIRGIYLEGPFLSREKCGAQNPAYCQLPNLALLDRLQEASGGLIRMVAIAPELEGAIDCIREGSNKENAYRFSIAHTMADYDTAKAAIEAGAKHVTHLTNAMPAFLNRAPGVIGAAFDDPDTYVELIGDGVHVHPSVIRAMFAMFGPKRIVLISDGTAATGCVDGKYTLGGQTVYKQGALVTLCDGTIAGSATNLFDCMKRVIGMGIPAEDVIRCATINPAKSVAIDDTVGSLQVGKRADLLICDTQWNLQRVIASGKEILYNKYIYDKEATP